MPFMSLISGVARPYELPPRAQHGVERVANVTPLHPVAAGEDASVVRSLNEYRRQAEATLPPQRRPATHARDLMSRPVETVPADASLSVARALIRLRGFRHLPVVSEHNVPVGMLSDRDLFGEHAEDVQFASELMRPELLTATPDTHLRDVARVMVHEKIGALPIVADDKTLIGIVTTSDLLEAIVSEAPIDLWT